MKSKEETFALNRIVHIITDLRPLLQDRARAVTPDGYVLWDCLNEMEEIARTLAGTNTPVTLQTVTEGEDNVATTGESKPENQGTEGAGAFKITSANALPYSAPMKPASGAGASLKYAVQYSQNALGIKT